MVEMSNEIPPKKLRNASSNIESPGHWRPAVFKDSFEKIHLGAAECKEAIKAATYLKWLFNIKPDLVIQISEKKAICIECKYESRESIYGDKKGVHIHQTELQEILMTKILGFECYCMTITKAGKGGTLSWSNIVELYRNEKQIPDAMLEALQQTVAVKPNGENDCSPQRSNRKKKRKTRRPDQILAR